MRRAALSLPLVLFLVSLFSAGEVEARRRGGVPIPIPGLRGEVLVKVLDLPRTPDFVRDGKQINLGYKFYSTTGGEWVGHIGSDREYLSFKPGGLELVLGQAGLQLPPVPQRPWQLSEFALLLIVLLLSAFGLFKKFMMRVPIQVPVPAMVNANSDGRLESSGMARADAAVQARVKAMQEAALRPTPSTAASRGAPPAFGTTRAAFGKRT